MSAASYRMSEIRDADADRRWGELYAECRPALYRTAALMVGVAEAEEIVQDAFERAFRQRAFLDETREPCAWLRTVVVRLAISKLRRHALWNRIWRTAAVANLEPDPALVDLRRAVLRLPPTQSAAVVMRYFHDADYAEIASVLNIEASSVGKLLTRARRALRDAIEPPPAR